MLVLGASELCAQSTYSYTNDEALDPITKLIWKRCLAGTEFIGSECVGTPTLFSYSDATLFATQTPSASAKK